MHLPMTVRVQQQQIRQGLASAIHPLFQMMNVPVAFIRQLLAVNNTSAFLFLPKFQPSLIPACSLHQRLPGSFFDNEFDGFEAFALCGVAPIAHTQQSASISFVESSGFFMA